MRDLDDDADRLREDIEFLRAMLAANLDRYADDEATLIAIASILDERTAQLDAIQHRCGSVRDMA